MEKNWQFDSEMIVFLAELYQESIIGDLKHITLDAVILKIFDTYSVKKNGKSKQINTFIDSMTEYDKEKILDNLIGFYSYSAKMENKSKSKETKDLLDEFFPVTSKSSVKIPIDEDLKRILNEILEEEKDNKDEIIIDSTKMLYHYFRDYCSKQDWEEDHLNYIKDRLHLLQNDESKNKENLLGQILNTLGFNTDSNNDNDSTILTPDELSKISEKMITPDSQQKQKKEDIIKDDAEFEAAGKHENDVWSKKTDPNSKTPYLDQFSYDMTRAAREDKYDPITGRLIETKQLVKILSCRTKSNALMIGDAGVGKSAIVEGLAQKIVRGEVPDKLKEKRICSLDLNALVSGTKYRGEYEERLQGIIKEVVDSPNIIIYIDEFHNLIGNGGTSGSGDGANILKPYLARGEFQCIGSTTQDEYRRFVKDEALKRRFQVLQVKEPTEEETFEMLKGVAPKYEEFHSVKYPIATLKACVEFSGRYISDRYFPDKAISVLDTAGAQLRLSIKKDDENTKQLEADIDKLVKEKIKAVEIQDFEAASIVRKKELDLRNKLEQIRIEGEKDIKIRSRWPEVTVQDIAEVITDLTNVPVDEICQNDLEKLRSMKKELSSKVINQEDAVDTIVKSLQRNYLGFRDQSKPIANILMVGQSGTGKTLICEETARKLFGSKENLIKLNMSEFVNEADSLSKLIGTGPGYIGYDDEPLLEVVSRKKNVLLLLDEIEKAHPKVFDIFLSIMDKGEITLGTGKKVDFRDAIIVFTGNIGTRELNYTGNGLGFSKATSKEDKKKLDEDIVKKAIDRTFRPEFINRLTSIIVFNPLGKNDLKKIFDIELSKLKERLKAKKYNLKVSGSMRDKIVDECNTNFGARDLQRNIQKYIETSICDNLLEEKDINSISGINVDWKEDKILISFTRKKKKVEEKTESLKTEEQ